MATARAQKRRAQAESATAVTFSRTWEPERGRRCQLVHPALVHAGPGLRLDGSATQLPCLEAVHQIWPITRPDARSFRWFIRRQRDGDRPLDRQSFAVGSMNRENRFADEICLVMGPCDWKQNLMSTTTAVDRETGPPA